MEQGPPIPTKLHVDSTDSDQTVALTQSDPSDPSRHDWKIVDRDVKPQHNHDPSESLISTVRWCVYICHFVGLAVSLLNDKDA